MLVLLDLRCFLIIIEAHFNYLSFSFRSDGRSHNDDDDDDFSLNSFNFPGLCFASTDMPIAFDRRDSSCRAKSGMKASSPDRRALAQACGSGAHATSISACVEVSGNTEKTTKLRYDLVWIWPCASFARAAYATTRRCRPCIVCFREVGEGKFENGGVWRCT